MRNEFHIYTDGACRIHTNKAGGWGFVIIDARNSDVIGEAYGYVRGEDSPDGVATSNRMELTAAIKAVSCAIKTLPDGNITIYSDSQVVVKGMTSWITNWRKNNWRKSNRKPVMNKDLWILLDKVTDMIDVRFQWIKGHNGTHWNEYADELAERALLEYESNNQ